MDSLVYILFFVISFVASIIGAVCGIGGGVIIKPILDAFGILSVASISFLSGCTVLSMSFYSIIVSKVKGGSLVDNKIGTPLAIGAAMGGIIGKNLFQSLAELFENQNQIGVIQAICLLVVTLGTLIYTINKEKIKTYNVEHFCVCLIIGLILGMLSSFLGIGGGPINLVVLYFFFSMDVKTAAQNSLYIILFSQITSLLSTLFTHSVPEFNFVLLMLMVLGGMLGGMLGRIINNKIAEDIVNKLFVSVMIIIIFICLFNTYRLQQIIV